MSENTGENTGSNTGERGDAAFIISPTNLTEISVTAQSVTISWQEPRKGSIVGYNIFSTNPTGGAQILQASVSYGTNSIFLDGLSSSTAYTLWIKSFNENTEISETEYLDITTSAVSSSNPFIENITAQEGSNITDVNFSDIMNTPNNTDAEYEEDLTFTAAGTVRTHSLVGGKNTARVQYLLSGDPLLADQEIALDYVESVTSTPEPPSPPSGDGFYLATDFQSQELGETPQYSSSTTVPIVSFQGEKVAKLTVREGISGSFGNLGWVMAYPENLVNGDEVWSRFRVFFPTGFSFQTIPSGALKFMRHHTNRVDGSNRGRNEFYIAEFNNTFSYYFLYEGSNFNDLPFKSGDQRIRFGDYPEEFPPTGRWVTFETYIKLGTLVNGVGTGTRRAWMDGILIGEGNHETLFKTTEYMSSWYIFTHWNGGGPQTQDWYIKDVILSSIEPDGRDSQGNPMIGV